jgi:hypothetical protein
MANTNWNSSDKSANVTLTGSSLIATASGSAAWVRAVDKQITGKFYWEAKPTVWGNANTGVGFCQFGVTAPLPTASGTCVVTKGGTIFVDGSSSGSTLSARAANDVIGIALDCSNQLVWFRVAPSGNWNGSATANPATGVGGISVGTLAGRGLPAYPLAMMGANLDSITGNFGDTSFSGTVSSGFTSGFTAGATPALNQIVTQVAIEQWGVGTPAMQLTQIAIEEWAAVSSVNTQAILTQIALEQWASVASVSAPGGGGPMVTTIF